MTPESSSTKSWSEMDPRSVASRSNALPHSSRKPPNLPQCRRLPDELSLQAGYRRPPAPMAQDYRRGHKTVEQLLFALPRLVPSGIRVCNPSARVTAIRPAATPTGLGTWPQSPRRLFFPLPMRSRASRMLTRPDLRSHCTLRAGARESILLSYPRL